MIAGSTQCAMASLVLLGIGGSQAFTRGYLKRMGDLDTPCLRPRMVHSARNAPYGAKRGTGLSGGEGGNACFAQIPLLGSTICQIV
jgi:hypothetical protein